jgi:hypothetical protein
MTENQTDVMDAAPQPQEEMLPKSEVTKKIGQSFNKGYEKAMAELQQQQQAPQQQSPGIGMGGMSQDSVQRMIADELTKHQAAQQEQIQRAQQEAEGRRILTELQAKVKDAEGRYPDFHEVTNQVDFTKIPEVLHYSNLADNAGDVLYDLAKNPGKIGTLRALPPELAALEVRRLSDSIRANQQASNRQAPPEPLGQVKPSSVGMDSGARTVKDYKRLYRG